MASRACRAGASPRDGCETSSMLFLTLWSPSVRALALALARRVHMEDAHIAQPFLYAEKLLVNNCHGSDNKKTAIEASLSGEEGGAKVSVTDKTPVGSANATIANSSHDGKNYVKIALPNHSLFAVFDGHGGSFAAEYAARNLLRVLTRDPNFCEYAEKWRGRDTYRDKWKERNAVASVASGENHKRGRDSDEKAVDISTTAATVDPLPSNINHTLEFALATYDQELMILLEQSLRDAFMDLDAEILRAVRGEQVSEANLPYGVGYDLSQHSLEGSATNHSPDAQARTATVSLKRNDNDNNCSTPSSSNACHAPPHPTPNDDEDSGTTAVVVLTTPRWLVCANAGDSRAVYSRSSHCAVPLSYDHKPEDEGEERRIREAGGYVTGGRVEGDLAVSRGLGDFRFKDVDTVLSGSSGERAYQKNHRSSIVATASLQCNDKNQTAEGTETGGEKEDVPMMPPSDQKVSPEPDIIVQNRNPAEDEFILICCDGIWDVQTNQECVEMVASIFEEGEDNLGLVCEEVS